MVILVMLGAPGGAVVAQSDGAPVVERVTGTEECHMTTAGTTTFGEDGVERYRDHISMCTPDTTDPRLNVPYEMVWETDCYPDGRCMMWGTTESLEPDGWRGSFVGWIDQSGVAAVGMSAGTGANEGLTTVGGFSGGDLSGNNTVDSLIYEGDPPPLP
jgi:hypothetical protein